MESSSKFPFVRCVCASLFLKKPKSEGLEPPVAFYRIFIPGTILSTDSSKQRLTFLLDRKFFASLRFDLVFRFCPKNHYDFAFAQPLFPSFEIKIFQLTSVSWFCL